MRDSELKIENLSKTKVIKNRFWIGLIIAFTVILGLILWLFFGSIPITIKGRGIIVSETGLENLEAKVKGSVSNINVRSGQTVKKGEFLLEIKDPELELKLLSASLQVSNLQKELAMLKKQIEEERAAETRALNIKISSLKFSVAQLIEQIEFFTKTLKNHKVLFDEGLISGSVYRKEEQELTLLRITFEEKKASLAEAEAAAQKEYRPQELKNKEEELLAAKEKRDLLQISKNQSKIYSPYDANILEVVVTEGDLVKEGSPILWLENIPKGAGYNSYLIHAFFPIDSGKRIKVGVSTDMTIDAVNENKYGSIEGTVIEVSPYVVSSDNIATKIQNKSIVDFLTNSSPAVIEAVIKPAMDKNHPGKLAWSSGDQPPETVTTGTTGEIDAVVDRIRPIFYLIPIPDLKHKKGGS